MSLPDMRVIRLHSTFTVTQNGTLIRCRLPLPVYVYIDKQFAYIHTLVYIMALPFHMSQTPHTFSVVARQPTARSLSQERRISIAIDRRRSVAGEV